MGGGDWSLEVTTEDTEDTEDEGTPCGGGRPTGGFLGLLIHRARGTVNRQVRDPPHE